MNRMMIVAAVLFLIGYLFPMENAFAAKMPLVEEDTTVYVMADKEPVFEGNLREWVNQNLNYPKEAMDQMIEGKVAVIFTIEKDGSVSNVKLSRSVHPLLDAETVRVMKSMPHWKPALVKKKPVRFARTYTILFKLQTKEDGSVSEFTYTQYLEDLKKEEEELKNNVTLTAEQQEKRVEEIRNMYLKKLVQEAIVIAKEEEMTTEEEAKLAEKMKSDLGHDDKFYDVMLEQHQEIKDGILERVKAQTPLLKLSGSEKRKLTKIYYNEINAKIKLLIGLGKFDFIQKFVATEMDYRRLELDKTQHIQKLLGDRFELYFEYFVKK